MVSYICLIKHSKPEYKDEKYLCESCDSAVDENTHVLYCHLYSEHRLGKQLNNDTDLADYPQKVLQI